MFTVDRCGGSNFAEAVGQRAAMSYSLRHIRFAVRRGMSCRTTADAVDAVNLTCQHVNSRHCIDLARRRFRASD
jgi:hypothetical protein